MVGVQTVHTKRATKSLPRTAAWATNKWKLSLKIIACVLDWLVELMKCDAHYLRAWLLLVWQVITNWNSNRSRLLLISYFVEPTSHINDLWTVKLHIFICTSHANDVRTIKMLNECTDSIPVRRSMIDGLAFRSIADCQELVGWVHVPRRLRNSWSCSEIFIGTWLRQNGCEWFGTAFYSIEMINRSALRSPNEWHNTVYSLWSYSDVILNLNLYSNICTIER